MYMYISDSPALQAVPVYQNPSQCHSRVFFDKTEPETLGSMTSIFIQRSSNPGSQVTRMVDELRTFCRAVKKRDARKT